MKDQLITFETAKLAKEKGFNVKCDQWYRFTDENIYGRLYKRGGVIPPVSQGVNRALAPTQSLLQKWLREECGMFISIIYYSPDTNAFGIRCDSSTIPGGSFFSKETYQSYEEALEKGLTISLNLIE